MAQLAAAAPRGRALKARALVEFGGEVERRDERVGDDQRVDLEVAKVQCDKALVQRANKGGETRYARRGHGTSAIAVAAQQCRGNTLVCQQRVDRHLETARRGVNIAHVNAALVRKEDLVSSRDCELARGGEGWIGWSQAGGGEHEVDEQDSFRSFLGENNQWKISTVGNE